MIDVRRRQQPVRGRERDRGHAAWVTRSVQAFVVARRDLAAWAKRGHPRQHAISQVRVQTDALAFGIGERPGLVPDGVRAAQPPKIVDKRCATQRGHLVSRQAAHARRRGHQVRHSSRVAGEVRRLQVNQVGHRLQDRIQYQRSYASFAEVTPRCSSPWLGVDFGFSVGKVRLRIASQRLWSAALTMAIPLVIDGLSDAWTASVTLMVYAAPSTGLGDSARIGGILRTVLIAAMVPMRWIDVGLFRKFSLALLYTLLVLVFYIFGSIRDACHGRRHFAKSVPLVAPCVSLR
jgi:hypothetical protein